MRGVGGPLLCIGDLLSDVAGDDDDGGDGGGGDGGAIPSAAAAVEIPMEPLQPSDLPGIFEENYDQLIKSLEGNDHSWTTLMLKLCAALRAADKLVNSASVNAESLLEKVAVLESILKRGDAAVAMAKDIKITQMNK
ncbi:uncharacterized protein LOC109725543 [Ananas comosus]|uniref:Uncharacterized protein LOC109725543 n=1 Tax=Ananas comosus TaxID=4615 RepID=A0A6P5GRC2_ANACO|nr:uncharacterized protein LOC109725543 [Ananas comosus]